jgi:hypothetical protein
MAALDHHGARERAAQAAALVRRLAKQGEAMAAASPRAACHAETLAALAGHAGAAADALGACLDAAAGARDGDALEALRLSENWIKLLSTLVDKATELYAAACGELGDRLALGAEHGLAEGAAELARAARRLTPAA